MSAQSTWLAVGANQSLRWAQRATPAPGSFEWGNTCVHSASIHIHIRPAWWNLEGSVGERRADGCCSGAVRTAAVGQPDRAAFALGSSRHYCSRCRAPGETDGDDAIQSCLWAAMIYNYIAILSRWRRGSVSRAALLALSSRPSYKPPSSSPGSRSLSPLSSPSPSPLSPLLSHRPG